MTERVQVILASEEKIRLQLQAQREGTSLSAWLRQVALDRLAETAASGRFATGAALRQFFKHCSSLESGQEPDWQAQHEVINKSRRSGASDT